MRERAAAIGASLEVREGATGGTLVALEVPLAGHERLVDPRLVAVAADREG